MQESDSPQPRKKRPPQIKMNRRSFLKFSGAFAGGAILPRRRETTLASSEHTSYKTIDALVNYDHWNQQVVFETDLDSGNPFLVRCSPPKLPAQTEDSGFKAYSQTK